MNDMSKSTFVLRTQLSIVPETESPGCIKAVPTVELVDQHLCICSERIVILRTHNACLRPACHFVLTWIPFWMARQKIVQPPPS